MDNYRPPTDFYFLRMAYLVSERGTCARRKVGCVFVNKRNHVIATGYNGFPIGIEDKNLEDREHKYYMKHEHQFENYSDAKEWYDSQNQ